MFETPNDWIGSQFNVRLFWRNLTLTLSPFGRGEGMFGKWIIPKVFDLFFGEASVNENWGRR